MYLVHVFTFNRRPCVNVIRCKELKNRQLFVVLRRGWSGSTGVGYQENVRLSYTGIELAIVTRYRPRNLD